MSTFFKKNMIEKIIKLKKFEADRLIIRPFYPKDYELWKEGYERRLPPQNEFDVGKVEKTDRAYFYNYLTEMKSLSLVDKVYVYGCFLKSTGMFIGVLEIVILERFGIDWGSFGVSVHNQHWGVGYGTEISKKAVEIARNEHELHRLECAVELNNFASQKMCEKSGLMYETTRKSFANEQGAYRDMKIYYINL